MNPTDLARLHAAAFGDTRAWSANELAALLASPLVFAVGATGGFALGRVIADEAELLTLAVAPEARRLGLGRTLLTGFEAESRARGATTAFLEVAADNRAALALYHAAGYAPTGSRPGYYARSDGTRVDARLLTRDLT